MKRPAPKERSPPHISLTSAPPAKPAPQPTLAPEQEGAKADAKPQDIVTARPVRKRQVTRRSVKEEIVAYGREFVGSGQQSDYDLTTKLGEGTFGYDN